MHAFGVTSRGDIFTNIPFTSALIKIKEIILSFNTLPPYNSHIFVQNNRLVLICFSPVSQT